MSRIFDALQRSQGESPDVPLATPATPAPPTKPATPAIPLQPLVAETVAAEPRAAEPLTAEPVAAEPVAAPLESGSYYQAQHLSSAAYQATPLSSASAVATAEPAADWLNAPADRMLHPSPSPEQRLITLSNPNSPGAEMFRVLSTRLAHMQDKRRLNKLLITSAVGDEGKSVVSVNLAVSLAQRPGTRVLLMEADLRRPTASALLSSSPLSGITEWHEGKISIENAIYQVEGLPLWLLSAGRGIEEPLPLLESLEFANLVQGLATQFDWMVLDCTPMLPMADASSLARLCDGVLVVVREGHTRRKVLGKALESIDRSKLLGTVFNEVSAQQVNYDRYYGYGYYNSNPSHSENGKGKAATA